MIRRRIKTWNFLKATKKKRLSPIVPPTSFVPNWHKHRFDKCIVTEPED